MTIVQDVLLDTAVYFIALQVSLHGVSVSSGASFYLEAEPTRPQVMRLRKRIKQLIIVNDLLGHLQLRVRPIVKKVTH